MPEKTESQSNDVDCATQPAEVFAEGEFDPRELYPLIAKTAAAAGWDDPTMDVYNHYEAET